MFITAASRRSQINELVEVLATFTQQQHTVVSPVFESVIRLRSHTVRLFTAWQPHSLTKLPCVHFQDSHLHSWNMLCERTRTGQLVVCHVIQCKREMIWCTNVCLPCVTCFCVFSVTYGDREMSCMSSKILDPVSFPQEPFPSVLCSVRDSNTLLFTQI